MKKKFIATCLTAVMLLGAVPCFADWELAAIDYTNPLKYELVPSGELKESDQDLRFSYNAVLDYSGDEISMLSPAGETMVSGLSYLDYLGGGLYSVQKPLEEDNVNKTSLWTSDGEALVSEECAKIVCPDNKEDGNARFYCMIYTTEETDDESEAIIYFTEDMFSMSVGEDDVLYKGYGRIYDVVQKQFVPDVEFTDITRYGFYDLGDSFLVDDGLQCTIYDADGKVIWETEGYLNGCSHHAAVVSTDGKYYIVNSKGEDVYSSDNTISVVSEPLDYYGVYEYGGEEEGYRLIDMEGKDLMGKVLPIIYSNNGSLIRTTDENDNMIIMDLDGSVVAENADVFYYVFCGYGRIERDDRDTITVVTPNGVIEDAEEYSGSNMIYGKEGKALVLNTGEAFSEDLNPEEARGLLPGLAAFKTQSSSGAWYSVVDLLTGETLLDAEYDEINVAGDYLYAAKEGSDGSTTWEVYKINVLTA